MKLYTFEWCQLLDIFQIENIQQNNFLTFQRFGH